MKQLTAFIILVAVLFSCKQQPLKQIEPMKIKETKTLTITLKGNEIGLFKSLMLKISDHIKLIESTRNIINNEESAILSDLIDIIEN